MFYGVVADISALREYELEPFNTGVDCRQAMGASDDFWTWRCEGGTDRVVVRAVYRVSFARRLESPCLDSGFQHCPVRLILFRIS